ncbi:putative two-component response regulator [Halobacteriovorax marinus SJ]|uniref:Two-component response regulator n=1 Tax=Halobacteriovorax marinus (strain ATCC BAA-682 / DSM 15412 / SJ) TaxID=862908 RepID=E1X271_HALMS|nr:response regulator [Halobacteriovorax marinus]CBW25027.1 putative two-component response regulator [Halobacteriovorax marinus SJ]
MNILVIEDELLIQKSLKRLLEKKGASVDVSSTGKEAIEMIINRNYDRIVCDLMLQDITGFDIIEESKKKYNINQIGEVFVIITAYSSPQILEKANSYGCRVLGKPFDNIEDALAVFLKES